MSGKSGKRGETAKAVEDGEEVEVARRLDELKGKVARAAELIAGLREANHALKGELAELGRRVGSPDDPPATKPTNEDSPPTEPASSAGDEERRARERERLELLLQERKAIRKKIESLLERVGRLES